MIGWCLLSDTIPVVWWDLEAFFTVIRMTNWLAVIKRWNKRNINYWVTVLLFSLMKKWINLIIGINIYAVLLIMTDYFFNFWIVHLLYIRIYWCFGNNKLGKSSLLCTFGSFKLTTLWTGSTLFCYGLPTHVGAYFCLADLIVSGFLKHIWSFFPKNDWLGIISVCDAALVAAVWDFYFSVNFTVIWFSNILY